MRWREATFWWFAGAGAEIATIMVAISIGARRIRLARESADGRAFGFAFDQLDFSLGKLLHTVEINPNGPAGFVNFAFATQSPGSYRDRDLLFFCRRLYSHNGGEHLRSHR
ncbi:hypothetical protein AB0I39_06925 [Kitasatospora purpeofusca]|uniref:hypothetical protein n=1 Tax=Kitasatospora purpeofusca TaxID=67352 RepID=UPI0033EA4E95